MEECLVKVCEFTVHGQPASRGSKRMVRNKYTGKTHLIDGKNSYRYMADISAVARGAMQSSKPVAGPVVLFWLAKFQRPKSHFGKNGLKPTAPLHHTQTPDCSKIVRGIEDALSGIVYADDKQIVQYAVGHGKAWTEGASCTEIAVYQLKPL